MKKLILILFCLIIVACDENVSRSEGPSEVVISDKVFTIPAHWQYWRYDLVSNSNNNTKYRQLTFEIDENTFQTIEPNYEDEHGISIEVRPIRSEWGERNFWTEKDRVYASKVNECREHTHKRSAYRVCKHESKNQLVNWADVDFQSIQNKGTGKYISIMGCSESETLNKICVVRSILLDNVQIEYSYRAKHYDRAVEIDFNIRDLLLGILKR